MPLALHGLAAYLSGTTTLTPEVDMTGDTARAGADGATPLKTREVLRVTIDNIPLAGCGFVISQLFASPKVTWIRSRGASPRRHGLGAHPVTRRQSVVSHVICTRPLSDASRLPLAR